MKNRQTKLLVSMAIYALLNGQFTQAVEVQAAETQELEDESFLQIDAAFDDAFEISKEEAPSNSTLLQLGGSLSHRIEIDISDSESDSESSESEPDDYNNIQQAEEDMEADDEEEEYKTDK